MLVHAVYFWLKPELTPAQTADFWRGLGTLKQIRSVETIHLGKAAATEKRPVIDHSYSAALVIGFKDVASHDAYQDDPIHLKFVADCKDYWTRVQIYDSQAAS
ncbi:MAG TPA: Dabb family protein [Opitutaceae bacterium]